MHHVFHVMGISVHITTISSSTQAAKKAASEAENIFRHYDKTFSRFRTDSELYALNDAAGTWHTVSPFLFATIVRTMELAEETNGAFDPCIGGYLAARGYGLPKNHTLPSPAPTYRDIELDQGHLRIRTPKGTVLEPAAIVKGMAIDAASIALADMPAWMINAGGDILTHGDFPDTKSWRVAIQHPQNPEAIMDVVSIHHEALATSGTYVVRGTHNGKPWHHQIDPRQGPVAGILSLSVIAPSAGEADTLASIAFLQGLEKGQAYLAQKKAPYLIVEDDLKLSRNALWEARQVPIETILSQNRLS